MSAQEKAAGVLDTPSTASQTNQKRILGNREADRKAYCTLQANFALLGITLTRSHRAEDGRITYEATRYTQTHYFTHLHDLQAFYIASYEAYAARWPRIGKLRTPATVKDSAHGSNLD